MEEYNIQNYVYGLGMMLEDLRVDQKGRIFILVEDTLHADEFYREITVPEEYQTLGNVEIIRQFIEQTNEGK
jgi:hypothetical protein